MVYRQHILMPQANYKTLLTSVNNKNWKSLGIYCVLATLLIIVIAAFLVCGFFGHQFCWKQSELLFFNKVRGFIDNHQDAKIIAWTRWSRLHTKPTKESQDTNWKPIIPLASSSKQFTDNNVSSGKFIVCYYTISGKLNSSKELNPSHIDPNICTHIIVGFARVVNCTLSLDEYSNIYSSVSNLKKLVPQLKVMISAGGINELQNTGFPQMTKIHSNRKIFIKSVLNITKKYNLDGLDIDWEFPEWSDSIKRERIHFVQLLQELRHAFDKSGRKLILSAAVAAPISIIDASYNIPNIAEHIDFINLMTYDYHFYLRYLPITGHNAPLYSRSTEIDYFATLNVNYSSLYWLNMGMPRNKIVLGIPTYGHSFKLDNPDNNGVNAPVKGIGSTGDKGFVNYAIICEFIKNGGKKVFDKEAKTPYVYKSDEWISFDDTSSIIEKIQFINKHEFMGAMIFSMNTDDWNATCDGTTAFPLIKTVKKMLNNSTGSKL